MEIKEMTQFSHSVIFTLFCLLSVVRTETPTVLTNVGTIKGFRSPENDYSIYLGIPYAKVNKSNPFGDSLPYPHFDKEYEAINESKLCVQREEFNHTIVGSLECLNINVYVPDVDDKITKLPVFVFIHGGLLRFGGTESIFYGPKFLMKHDIILVTFNYRVGPYGFLCLTMPEVSGNQGIKDQMRALQWIKENIESFGGDPDKITIGGNSSGAVNIDYIMHTLKENEKLFDKVILQSGNVYSTAIKLEVSDDTIPIKLANNLGYNISSLEEALHYLIITDPELVINASVNIVPTYNICLENSLDDGHKIVTDYPINVKVPIVKDMPILIGSTNAEAQFYFEKLPLDVLKETDLYSDRFFLDVDDHELRELENIVNQFYIGVKNESSLVKNVSIKFSSDFYHYYGTKSIMKKYVENGAKNIYYYIFSYDGKRNYMKIKEKLSAPGASHGDELGYLFDMQMMNFDFSANDTIMIQYMTELWTNFVKYGNPTPTTTDLIPIQWLPYRPDKEYYMNIDLELNLKTGPYSRRMAFWDLFYDVNGKHRKGYKENSNDMKINN